MNKTKAVLLVSVVVALGALGYGMYARGRAPRPRWQTAKVFRTTITSQVTATGALQPIVTSPVGAVVSGTVWRLHADFNSHVEANQVLVELDPALFKNAVAQAEANLASAQANTTKAEAQLADAQRIRDRTASLAKEHFVAQSDADTAEANFQGAQAGLQAARAAVIQARAQLDKARLDLEHSVIRSPVTGTVISRNVDVGQAVAATLNAPTIFTIAQDLTKMQVHANIDEADIGQVKVGEVATFTVDAFRGEKFKATVSQVRNAAQTIQNVVTYDVVMDVDNRELKLRPGMTANVRIVSATKDNVAAVPNGALRFKPPLDAKGAGPGGGLAGGSGGGLAGGSGASAQGGGSPGGGAGGAAGGAFGGGRGGAGRGGDMPILTRGEDRSVVYVPEGETAKRVSVEIGITDGNLTEVKNLKEGTEVIVDLVKDKGAAGPGGPPRPFGRGF